MIEVTGAQLKARFGSRWNVRNDDWQSMPHKHHMTPDLHLYAVNEQLDAEGRYGIGERPRYFEDLDAALEEAYGANARLLQRRIAAQIAVTDKLRSKWTLFRLWARRCAGLRWLGLSKDRAKLAYAYLDNCEYVTTFSNTLAKETIPVRRIGDAETYTIGGPLLDEGQKVYRVCFRWVETQGVNLDELTIRSTTVYDQRGTESSDPEVTEVDYSIHYGVATYTEDDERSSTIEWRAGELHGSSSGARYFLTREQAETFLAEKRAELTARIQGEA